MTPGNGNKGNNSVKSRLKDAGNDVFYVDTPIRYLPKRVRLNSKVYSRFIDFIYIPAQCENLSSEQVITVNNLRRRHFDELSNPEVNRKVGEIFTTAAIRLRPNTVLELGPGRNPLFRSDHHSFRKLYMADLNQDVVAEYKERNVQCFQFGFEDPILLPELSVDLILAVFVFQFRISPHQIGEMHRVLADDGVIMANVYRRLSTSRQNLKREFSDCGFRIKVIPDEGALCRSHEYWIIHKGDHARTVREVINYFEKRSHGE